ncbi:MAG: DUF3611 family protein [Cyanobacteria bacterium J06626_23]
MTGELSYSLSPAIRRVATRFRVVGWISFWIQIVSGVIATLLFASALLGIQSMNESAAAGGGLFLGALGLLAVYVGAYWAFRYTRFARKMRTTNPDLRPRPKDAAKIVTNGLIISLVGMGLALLGTGAITGTLLVKVISQPQQEVVISPGAFRRFVEPLDIFIVQASTNTLIAHFAAILSSLWLARTVNRQ